MPEQNPLPPFWEDPQVTGQPIDLLEFMGTFVRRWPFILAMGVGGGLAALAIAFSLTPQFTSQAVFLPPTQQISSGENPLAALLKTPTTAVYSGLLLSDTVLGNVVKQCNLQQIFKSKNLQDARVRLKQITTVTTSSTGFVTVQVKSKDRELAKAIADSFLQSLAVVNDRMAISQAAQQRHVFETQLQNEKDELEKAEVELAKAQEASGVVQPQTQTQAGLLAIDSIRNQIRLAQVRLTALLQAHTDQAPEVVLVRSQIQALEAQAQRLENGGAGAAGDPLTASKAPSVNLQFVMLEQEVKYHQTLFDIMAKQFEGARMMESSAAPGVQVVDYPEVSIRKAWPSYTLFGLGGGLLGGFMAMGIIFAKNRLQVLRAHPQKAASLLALRDAGLRPSLRP